MVPEKKAVKVQVLDVKQARFRINDGHQNSGQSSATAFTTAGIGL